MPQITKRKISSPYASSRTNIALNNHNKKYQLITDIQESELSKFDPFIIKQLDRFCLNPLKTLSLESNEGFRTSDGSFLDLGELQPGRKCIINIFLRNNTPHEIQIDASTRGFVSADIRLTTTPGSFAAGMKRKISIVFTVPDEILDVVGFIDIYILPVRNEPSVMISCPIFYRISHQTDYSIGKFTPLPICNVRNLPELLRKFCSKEFSPVVSFEKNRSNYPSPTWNQNKEALEMKYKGRLSRNCSPEKSYHSPTSMHKSTSIELLQVAGCYRGIRKAIDKNSIEATNNELDFKLSFPLMK